MKLLFCFPPLVETNFGGYYPSTAVLAAWARQCGANAVQLDLNRAFLDAVLGDDRLERIGNGELGPATPIEHDSPVAIHARIARKNRDLFYDLAGRQRPLNEQASHLMREVLEPFRVDAPVASLDRDHPDAAAIPRLYRQFFAEFRELDEALDGASLIAISVCMGPQLAPAVQLARHVRHRCPSARVLLGGPAISLMQAADQEHLLRTSPMIDCLIRFEGEAPLQVAIASLSAGRWDPALLPGAAFLSGDAYVEVAPVPGVPLGSLPHPLYEPALLAKLASPTLGIIQARGCYWGQCSYCDFIELYEGSSQFRGRKAPEFVDELEAQMARLGVSDFSFVTESIPPGFARRVSEEILRRELPVRWTSFVMVDPRFDAALLSLMKAAGCRSLVVGMETMTDRVLKLVKKASTRETNITFLRAAHEAALSLTVNIIPDLPSMSFAESMSSLQVFVEHESLLGEVSIFPFEATRSSEIGRRPEEFSLVKAGRLPVVTERSGQAQYAANHLGYVDPAMTDDERAKVIAAYLQFAAGHNAALSQSLGENPHSVAADDPTLADRWLDLLFVDEERCLLTNALNRQSAYVPTRWGRLIATALSRPHNRVVAGKVS